MNPTSNSVAGGMQRAQQRQATTESHIRSVTGKVYKVWGLVNVQGTGEALLEVSFPVLFTELPTVSGGGFHLPDGEVVQAGRFPEVRVGVKAWDFDQQIGNTRFYKGAEIVIVVSGHNGMLCTAHYQIEGRAIVPPVFTDTLAEDIV